MPEHRTARTRQGFAFVGRQVQLAFANRDYFLDLLFYHLKLRCYVVIELKAVPFDPAFIGQISVYLSAVDDLLRVQLETAGSPPSVSIGREAPCELVITDDPDLSRRHARIFWNGSSWMLEDLGSSNGTFIGEFQVARRLSKSAVIGDGHIFRVGLTRLRLGGTKDERVATAAAAANATRS